MSHSSKTARVPGPALTTTVAALAAAAALTVADGAGAVGTRTFVLDECEAFEGGDLAGVAVGSDGTVRAGWTLGNTAVSDASSVWSALALDDGTVLLGTGSDGRIYQAKAGKISVAAETGSLAVSTLVRGFDGDVIAGSFPEGALFRARAGALDGGKLATWIKLPDAEDVWGLAFDPKNRALYAATGPNGKLFRIDQSGKAETYFDSDEAHLVSVAVGEDGSVYAGSSGRALLYRLTGPGRATVLRDFDGDDVKAIAVVPMSQGGPHAGAVYVIANDYHGALKELRPAKESKPAADPNPAKPAKPGEGTLMRFAADGRAELLLVNKDSHFVSLGIDARGMAFAGTGTEGRVFTVDDNHVKLLLADTGERQIGALVLSGPKRLVVGSDPVVLHEITGSGGVDAVWTSKVLDAGMRAHFGLLEWTATGALELQTRSGNTSKPDTTWSAWSAALAKPGKVQSPAARFLQIRARWSRDPAAVLREVKLSFVTDNARALVTEVKVGGSETDTGGDKVPASGGPPDEPSSDLKISWKVDNPDNDKLRFRLFYQADGGDRWVAILDPGEELTKSDYTWDTSGLPEGRYRVRVLATDELSNPPDRTTSHELGSRAFVVDSTPPQLTRLSLVGGKLQGTATDGVGPIARIEFALVGSKTFYPIFPGDGVLDEPTEEFELDVSAQVPAGPQLVVVRAYDSAGNVAIRTVGRGP